MTREDPADAVEPPTGLTAEDLERIRRFVRVPRHRRTPDLLAPDPDRDE